MVDWETSSDADFENGKGSEGDLIHDYQQFQMLKENSVRVVTEWKENEEKIPCDGLLT